MVYRKRINEGRYMSIVDNIHMVENLPQGKLGVPLKRNIVTNINRLVRSGAIEKPMLYKIKSKEQKSYVMSYMLTKDLMYQLYESTPTKRGKQTIANAINIMYGELEYKPKNAPSIFGECAKRGISPNKFWTMSKLSPTKFRLFRLMGKGNVVYGEEVYIKACHELANIITDMSYYLYDKGIEPTERNIAKELMGWKKMKHNIVTSWQDAVNAVWYQTRETGLTIQTYRRIRKIIRRWKDKKERAKELDND
jgi:hypothetical protein